MTDRDIRPYGTWPAALGARDLAGAALRFGVVFDHDGVVHWTEGRPAEGGRTHVMRADPSGPVDLTPPGFDIRSRVNEYGGQPVWSSSRGLYLVNDAAEGALFLLPPDGRTIVIAAHSDWRFADGCDDATRERTIAVAEVHDTEGHPRQLLVALDGHDPVRLHEGRDFYGAPRMSPDGATLVWLAWDLPFMPWQSAELWSAEIGVDGGLVHPRCIGGGLNRAAFQPTFAPDGTLYCVMDGSEASRLYRLDQAGWTLAADCPGEAGRPLWSLGMTSFAIGADGGMVLFTIDQGRLRGWRRAATTMRWSALEADAASISYPVLLADGALAGSMQGDRSPPAIADLSQGRHRVIRASGTAAPNPRDISIAERLALQTPQAIVHALYYPPTNAAFRGPDGAKPPMVVSAHGGPTGHADRGFIPKVQYWTQRGFAYLDVDYRGSTGYGSDYRRVLDGQMGIVDVGDVAAAAQAAAAEGYADENALFISGGSAGGYVVLGALAFHDVFTAGCSRYGIGDLKSLAEHTHKFEAGYLDTLLGLTGGPEDDAIFRARSPLFHVERITVPVLLLQGSEDKVVPPEQSRDMAAALTARGVPVAYVEIEGEGHGFRGVEAIVTALESEYAFYAAILGIEPAEAVPALAIANWT